ncbi:MAG: kynureninase [Salibacteraceae bacterium]|nr:kynureninase [Salibacteraceae bacterium]MDP4687310.1 kynureninase [Salibacteraceae bacterium]MDP4763243.1 kynureninase [Salibacteraceae bacterium]MDP4964038.1 kynureninase [Salibacteraceae bacterium]
MHVENSLAYAQTQDKNDALASFRDKFYHPVINGKQALYFTGNSLGLQPKSAEAFLKEELDAWRQWGVEGHFEAKRPWFSYHEFFSKGLAYVTGAKETEVVAMGSLTANLHSLMVSFYRPTSARYKILCEKKAFPSDTYALQSQAKLHGYEIEDAIVEIAPAKGSDLITEDAIIEKIFELGDSLAMVMIGGVNYYSGQAFDMASITDAAHKVGATCGFDLAHGIGNIELKLHEWQVDFAAWCTYKYLNSGPGSVGGIFVHENHHKRKLPILAGWWGHDKDTRFKMEPEFIPMQSAEAWQMSNAPVFNMAIHLASLEIFQEATMEKLWAKSRPLTDYLEFVVGEVAKETGADLEIITPKQHRRRGCQLSIVAHGYGRKLFDTITAAGVIADWREPNVIRMAPVPLYNSYEDVFRFGEVLKAALK